MKRIFPILTAAVMAVCTLSVLPQTAASAITNDEILEQQLTMPVISIDTLGNSVNTKESYTDAKITIWDENGTIDTEDASISIRLRGNSTLNLDKKSYRFKFPKSPIRCIWAMVLQSRGIWLPITMTPLFCGV